VSYINFEAISLIVSFMMVSKLLDVSGAFSRLSIWIISKEDEWKILTLLLLISELSAALLMNDTALFFMVPLVITLSRISGRRLQDLAILVTIAVNVGSALTPFGNPQNIIIWSHYHVMIAEFVIEMTPFFLLSTGLLLLFATFTTPMNLRKVKIPMIKLNLRLTILALILLFLNVVSAQVGLYWIGLAITVVASAVLKKELLFKIDIPLLAIFCFLFMDFGQISHLMEIWRVIPSLTGFNALIVSALLSQLISNVPATITLLNHIPDWRALAIGVNLGGTGLITGSMANVITLRLAGIDLKKFHEISIPYFIGSLACFLSLSYLLIYP